MDDKNGSGLLERVQVAVQPLTAEGNYQLEMVEYGTYYRDVEAKLVSEEMAILFQGKLSQHTGVNCYFTVHSLNKTFDTKYLFQALKIDIPIKKGDFIRDLNLEQFKEDNHRDYKEIEYLLKRTGFIEEVARLCIELKQKLPEIYPLFNPDTIDETIRRYTNEFRKHKQYGGMF